MGVSDEKIDTYFLCLILFYVYDISILLKIENTLEIE